MQDFLRAVLAACLGLACLLTAGCDEPPISQSVRSNPPKKTQKSKKSTTKPAPKEKTSSTTVAKPSPVRPQMRGVGNVGVGTEINTPNHRFESSGDDNTERTFTSNRGGSGGYAMAGSGEDVAVKQLTAVVKASLEVAPTLVVYCVDRTPSASKLVSQSVSAIGSVYNDGDLRQAGANGKLLTSVVAFDESSEFLVDTPTADWQTASSALSGIKAGNGGQERPFAAVKEALEKYLPLRKKERYEVIVVLVTDEAGSDRDQTDAVVDLAKKNVIPVYVLGTPAPWGQTNPFLTTGAKAPPKAEDKDDTTPVYGPETVQSERIDIEMWVGGGGYQGGMGATMQIDSGFGPYHLERLARASGGRFFCIRAPGGGGYSGAAGGGRSWPTGSEMQFDPEVVSKYAPDYVSQRDYQQLVAASKTRQALVEAAQLEPIKISDQPQKMFAKRNEAQMANQLNTAQQFAARHSPPVDKLYSILTNGEGDREKVTNQRLKAEFDLAMGRTLAAKVRLDGYNSMLAALKRGKTFQNERSSSWSLEQGSMIETGSAIQKMADKAKMYLERVVKEHPGTPWAKLAEDELQVPLGWTWKEV